MWGENVGPGVQGFGPVMKVVVTVGVRVVVVDGLGFMR